MARLLVVPSQRMLDVREAADRAVQDDAGGSLRVGRCEQGGQPGALRYPEDRGPLGAHGVEHGEDVVRAFLECRGGQHAASVREPAAPAVEDEKPTELGQPPEERGKRRLFPEHLDVGRQPVGPHEIHRTLTDDLVGDAHIARPGVPRDRLAHRCLSQFWLRSTILLLRSRPMARPTHQALHVASRTRRCLWRPSSRTSPQLDGGQANATRQGQRRRSRLRGRGSGRADPVHSRRLDRRRHAATR